MSKIYDFEVRRGGELVGRTAILVNDDPANPFRCMSVREATEAAAREAKCPGEDIQLVGERHGRQS